MIYIFCGNNISDSRKAFFGSIQKIKEKDISPIYVTKEDVMDLKNIVQGKSSLFNIINVYYIENVLSKKQNRDVLKTLELSKIMDFYIWEEKMVDKDIKRYFKNSKIFSFNYPDTIWKLLDSLYEGNVKNALQLINNITGFVDENIILYMIKKRIKELILLKENTSSGTKQLQWQMQRLTYQLKKWDYQNLIEFYDKLYSIEKNSKSQASTFSIKESLDILFCFYLQ